MEIQSEFIDAINTLKNELKAYLKSKNQDLRFLVETKTPGPRLIRRWDPGPETRNPRGEPKIRNSRPATNLWGRTQDSRPERWDLRPKTLKFKPQIQDLGHL